MPGRSLLDDVGDRTHVAQIGTRRGSQWRSIRLEDLELRENGLGERVVSVDSESGGSGSETAQEHLHTVLRSLAPWPSGGSAEEEPLSREEHEALKALGYVD